MSKKDYSIDFNEGRYAARLMNIMENLTVCVDEAKQHNVTNYEMERIQKAKQLIYEAEHSYYIRHRTETKEERLIRQEKEEAA